MSMVACGVPRYEATGGCTSATAWKTLQARFETEPTPASASVTFFSFERRYVMKSLRLSAGTPLRATSIIGERSIKPICTKSVERQDKSLWRYSESPGEP